MANWASRTVLVPKGTQVSTDSGWGRGSTVTNEFDDMIVADVVTNGNSYGENIRYHKLMYITGNYDFVSTPAGNGGTEIIVTNSGKIIYVVPSYGTEFDSSMGENATNQSIVTMNGITKILSIDTDSVKANELWDVNGDFVSYIEKTIPLYNPVDSYMKWLPISKQIQRNNNMAWFVRNSETSMSLNPFFTIGTYGFNYGFGSSAQFELYRPIPYFVTGFVNISDTQVCPFMILTDPTYVIFDPSSTIVGKSGKTLYIYIITGSAGGIQRNGFGLYGYLWNVAYRLYIPTNQIQELEDFNSNDSDIIYMADTYLNNYVPAPDYMDLNIPGNSVKPNAVYEFVNPKPGIFNQAQDQIKMEWSVEGATINPETTKQLIFDIPANSKAWCLFDGETLYFYSDNPGCLYTWGIYVGGTLVAAANQPIQNGLIAVDDIFSMYNAEQFTPSGNSMVYNVKIYTNHIFLRQVYYAFSKEEIPVAGDPTYELWQPGTDSIYVRPDGLPDAGGNIIPITTHILSFNDIAAMKAASDAEHDI